MVQCHCRTRISDATDYDCHYVLLTEPCNLLKPPGAICGIQRSLVTPLMLPLVTLAAWLGDCVLYNSKAFITIDAYTM